jgi:hypothetical protein
MLVRPPTAPSRASLDLELGSDRPGRLIHRGAIDGRAGEEEGRRIPRRDRESRTLQQVRRQRRSRRAQPRASSTGAPRRGFSAAGSRRAVGSCPAAPRCRGTPARLIKTRYVVDDAASQASSGVGSPASSLARVGPPPERADSGTRASPGFARMSDPAETGQEIRKRVRDARSWQSGVTPWIASISTRTWSEADRNLRPWPTATPVIFP